jgi:hypothetical protein
MELAKESNKRSQSRITVHFLEEIKFLMLFDSCKVVK